MITEEQIQIIQEEIKDDKSKKLLYIVPESAGDIFLSTGLLKSMSESYKDFHIYFACKKEYQSLLKNNPYIYKVIEYFPIMENAAAMEGISNWKGLFDISIMGTVSTQRLANYWHNGLSNIAFSLKE